MSAQLEALTEALATLNAFPDYAGDVTYAAVWKWLTRKEKAEEQLAAALNQTNAEARGE